jgi:transcriptional regulator of acetoin/glycerol metabolism
MSKEKSTLRLEEASPGGPSKVLAIQWLGETIVPAPTVLDRPELVIGRGSDVAIVLNSDGVSRRHAELYRDGPIYALRDLGSTNGTYLNGKRIQHAAIANGDVLRFGDGVGLVVRLGEAEIGALSQPEEIVPGVLWGPGLSGDRATVEHVARSGLPIAIIGPTGVGKTYFARAIHALSGRSGIHRSVDCAALSPALADGELFGNRRVAVTGAEQATLGHFLAADGGTLLLDELGELPATVQAKLFRVLEDMNVVPVGDDRPVPFDVHVLSACQEPFAELVKSKRLRADLAARLAGFVLEIPPLRERRADVALFFRYFLDRYSGGKPPRVEAKLLEQLLLYAWPSNVRELDLLTRRLLALHADEGLLIREFLPKELSLPVTNSPTGDANEPSAQSRREHDLERLAAELRRHDGNLKRAAESAGISRQRAYRLLGDRTVAELMGDDSGKGAGD